MLLLGVGLSTPALADTLWLTAEGEAQRSQLEADLAPAKVFAVDVATHARTVNAGITMGTRQVFPGRDAMKARLKQHYQKLGRPLPPSLQNPAAPLSPAEVQEALTISGSMYFLRGRVLGCTRLGGGQPTTVSFEAWWRDPARAVPRTEDGVPPANKWPAQFSAQPADIPWTWISRIEHEADGDLDFRLLLSSRDQLKGETTPSAPVGSMLWQQRMHPVLDPGGRLRLVARVAAPDQPVDPAQVEITGWVLNHLGGAPIPSDAAELAAYQEQVKAELQDMATQSGVDPFSPLLITGTPDDAVRDLVRGIAQSARYRWLRGQQNAGTTTEREQFHSKAMTITALLCSIAKVDPTKFASTPALVPVAERYHRFGIEARAALIRIIEAGAPGVLSPDDPPDVVAAWTRQQSAALTDPAARAAAQAELQQINQAGLLMTPPSVRAADLPVDVGEQAYHALKILQAFKAFWFRYGAEGEDDGERIIRALVGLGRPVEGFDPRANDRYRQRLPLEAKLTLIKLLRPNRRLASDRDEEALLIESARRYREDLAPMFTDADGPTREFLQEVLTHAGLQPVATESAIDGLFGAALGTEDPNAPETPDGDERRARREYSITTLVILGNLADESYEVNERKVGELVLERITDMRVAAAEERATRSQRSFLRTLTTLEGTERADEDLRDRVTRLRRDGRVVGERVCDAELREARRRLQAAVTEGKGPEVLGPLRTEVERLRTRLTRIREQ